MKMVKFTNAATAEPVLLNVNEIKAIVQVKIREKSNADSYNLSYIFTGKDDCFEVELSITDIEQRLQHLNIDIASL